MNNFSHKEIKYKDIVLSGSGPYLAYFVGALEKLYHLNIRPKSLTGTSGGAFICMLISCGYSIEEIKKKLLEIRFSDFKDINLNPFNKLGYIKGDKLYKKIKELLPKDVVTFKDCRIPLTITTTNLSNEYNTDRLNYFSTYLTPDMDIAIAVRASMSIPLLFDYVVINNQIHVDGGISNNFPINALPNDKDVIGIKIDSSFAQYRKFIPSGNIFSNVLDFVLNIIDTFMNTIEREHIKDSTYSKIIYLKSGSNYSYDMFAYTQDDIKKMLKLGYNYTHEYLKNKKWE